jgi:hypothetical protein
MPPSRRLAAPCLAFALAPIGLTGPVRPMATGAVALPLRVGGAGRLTVTGSVPQGHARISVLGRGPDGTARRISVHRDYRDVTGRLALRTRRAGRVRLSVPVAAAARGELILRIRFSRASYELFTVVPLHRR